MRFVEAEALNGSHVSVAQEHCGGGHCSQARLGWRSRTCRRSLEPARLMAEYLKRAKRRLGPACRNMLRRRIPQHNPTPWVAVLRERLAR